MSGVLARDIEAARPVTIAGSGHMSPMEEPAQVAAEIRSTLVALSG